MRAWRHRAGAKFAEHRSASDNSRTRAAASSDDRPDLAGTNTGGERSGADDHEGGRASYPRDQTHRQEKDQEKAEIEGQPACGGQKVDRKRHGAGALS